MGETVRTGSSEAYAAARPRAEENNCSATASMSPPRLLAPNKILVLVHPPRATGSAHKLYPPASYHPTLPIDCACRCRIGLCGLAEVVTPAFQEASQ